MKKLWIATGSFLLAALLAAPAFAAADWEWSRDKGWSQGLGQAKPTPVEQINFAWSLEQDGQYLNATKQYFLLLKTYPDSDEAGRGLQRLAACLFMMENYYDSYKALEQVIKSYPLSARKTALVKLEFLIGRKFQEGARKDLLNDKELPVVSQNTSIEIFKSVIENDPVGPYAGSATLAIAECYKKLNDVPQGIIYCDRVLNEFSLSTDLVAKARVLKTTLEVMQGKANITQAKMVMKQSEQAMAEQEKKKAAAGQNGQPAAGQPAAGQDASDQDIAPVTDYKSELSELEEQQAKKLWDSAEFYKSRGSRDSISAYKFSLEQIVVRFPNTSYASKARKIVGSVKVPPKDNSYLKINLPRKQKEPNFAVQQNTPNYVEPGAVPVPGMDGGNDKDLAEGSSAKVNPVAPPELPQAPAPATTKNGKSAQPKAASPIAQASADTPDLDAIGGLAGAGQNARADATPPGVSGAGLKPGALQPAAANKPAASADAPRAGAIATAPAHASADAPASTDNMAVPVRPVPQGTDGMAPPDSGSSAIPAMIRKNPSAAAVPARSPSAAIPAASVAPAALKPAAKSSAGVTPAAPQATASTVAAPAKPAPDPAVKAAADAASSKARTSANEAAAKSGSWEFSEEEFK